VCLLRQTQPSRDITDQRTREEAERERTRLEGALLVSRTVAHEINNALSPVLGYADLLALSPAVAAEPALRDQVTHIALAAEEVADKVRKLQSIVRLEEQRSPLGPDRPILDLDRSTTA
jgi:signal transduction histidine kinase